MELNLQMGMVILENILVLETFEQFNCRID